MVASRIVALFVAVVALASGGEQLRLKFPATVDILDGGKVVGQKKLKAGTVIEVADAPAAAGANEAKAAPKLRLSKLSPIMFKTTRPAVAHVFNASIALADSYYGQFEGKEGQFWSVDVRAENAEWKSGETFYGYARKTAPIGREIAALLADGTSRKCRIKISLVRDPDWKDLVNIEAVELVEDKGD